ncbi:dephospho-CoA kinase [Cryobacterium sp. CG_9.6]|uniref:dephospho-CoA kinase n=1 Tax=Cryobacterium sp. CG_9.6 TaxID=2760710 RepID=UPI0024765A6E|nr:dephospho-CoA kinase [Cryobacterium sp. CG_9.6]MDH6236909.1 dephospho-CoA kinase [Cryobacterium sp. CG_9.6]
MYLIGLTGGIASGKSTVAKRLAEQGAVHIDADKIARYVVEPDSPGLAAIVAKFGNTVLLQDGSLDRSALGAIIFSDATQREALNAITHPEIWSRTQELIEEAEQNDPWAVVVYDVPLLAEAAADRRLPFDLIVVVHADTQTRIERMMRDRGMSRADATARINSQASDAERLAIADIVIDNTGTIERTREQADAVWRRALLALD